MYGNKDPDYCQQSVDECEKIQTSNWQRFAEALVLKLIEAAAKNCRDSFAMLFKVLPKTTAIIISQVKVIVSSGIGNCLSTFCSVGAFNLNSASILPPTESRRALGSSNTLRTSWDAFKNTKLYHMRINTASDVPMKTELLKKQKCEAHRPKKQVWREKMRYTLAGGGRTNPVKRRRFSPRRIR